MNPNLNKLRSLYPTPSVVLFLQVTGDGPQSQPGINIVTNSSASSTTATATNPSNTSTNIASSGATTSVLRDGDPQNSGTEMLSGKTDVTEGGPPPLPGKHEGKPSSTWTPPFVGITGNQSQVGKLIKWTPGNNLEANLSDQVRGHCDLLY